MTPRANLGSARKSTLSLKKHPRNGTNITTAKCSRLAVEHFSTRSLDLIWGGRSATDSRTVAPSPASIPEFMWKHPGSTLSKNTYSSPRAITRLISSCVTNLGSGLFKESAARTVFSKSRPSGSPSSSSQSTKVWTSRSPTKNEIRDRDVFSITIEGR